MKEVNDALDHQHALGGHRLGQSGDDGGQGVDDGVQDLAVGHDHQDAPGDAHDDGAHGDVLGAGDEVAGHLVGAGAADDAPHDPHAQEDGGDVQHAPAELHDAEDDDSQTGRHHQQHQRVPAGQPGVLDGQDGAVLLGQLQVTDVTGPRVPLHLVGIAQDHQRHRHQHAHPHGDAQGHAGEGGQLGDLLGHAHGEGVEETGGEADGRAEGDHGHAHDGVIAQSPGQGDADGNEDDGLLRHAKGGAAQGEDEHHDGDDELLTALELVGQLLDAVLHGAGLGDDVEGAAHHEDEHHDVGHLHHALGDGVEEAEKAHRGGVHVLEGVGVHHRSVGGLAVDPLVAAGGDDVGADGHDGDDEEQDHKGMGEFTDFSLSSGSLERLLR